jgi:hypothetical protein
MDAAYNVLTTIFKDTIIPVIGESVKSAPDALFLGTALLSFLTQSFPLLIFLLALIEVALGIRFIGGIVAAVRPDLVSMTQTCRQGFPEGGSLAALAGATSTVTKAPHFTVSSLTAASLYLLFSLTSKSESLQALGESWAARIPTSFSVTTAILLTIFFGLYITNCISMGNMLFSIVVGVMLGGGAFYINDAFFGPEATNFQGLPLLLSKFQEGDPVYVCSKIQ